MATLGGGGGGGGGGGRGREGEGDDAGEGPSSNKRPRLIITLVDSSDDEEGDEGDKKPSATAAAASSSSSNAAAAAAAAAPTAREDLPVLPYYLGRVEGLSGCFNEQCLAVGDAIAGDYTKAILSNYMYEWEWLLGECPGLLAVPCLACYGDTGTAAITQMLPNIETFKPAIKRVFPYGTHHSKWALLWYGGRGVRVVITTANFIQIDWENKTEAVFVQDFPFLPASSPDDASEFGRDLRDYLRQLNSWENESPVQPAHGPGKGHAMLTTAMQELARVDFSSAQAVLVASVPGIHRGGEAVGKYGHLRLRRLLEQEPIPADVFLPPPSTDGASAAGVVAQFSSMGSHAGDGKWVREEFEESLLASRSPRLPSPQQMQGLRPHVVWPRLVDVDGSIEGRNAGGALPCRPGNVHTDASLGHRGGLASCHPFLQQRLSRFAAERWGRQRAMPHHKSFLRYALRREDGLEGMVARLAWVLVSSHNFSKSAWGVLQKQGSQLRVESFELGVLFLPSRFPRLARTCSLTPDHPLLGLRSARHRAPLEAIRGFYSASCDDARRVVPGLLPIPIPYALPPPPYAPADVPWTSPQF